MPKKTKQQSKPLTGQPLLTKVKTLNDLTREEKAKACGYSKVAKDGTERINIMAFLNAVLDAEGMDLDAQGDRKKKHGGRPPHLSHQRTIQWHSINRQCLHQENGTATGR